MPTNQNKFCNTCGCEFDDPDCLRATLKNRSFGATLDEKNNVIQECCESCQQELYDSVEESDRRDARRAK